MAYAPLIYDDVFKRWLYLTGHVNGIRNLSEDVEKAEHFESYAEALCAAALCGFTAKEGFQLIKVEDWPDFGGDD